MNAVSNLMTLEECASFAGVSLETVRQYAEFGLLSALEKEGGVFFKEEDVATIFHLSTKKNSSGKKTECRELAENNDLAVNSDTVSAAGAKVAFSDLEQSSINDEIEVTTNFGQYTTGESLRIVELLQLNQNLREQLNIVKEERDWLRVRLERLEARSEREQMLLLSESETVRNLINQKSGKKRSLWAFSLPWNNS